MRAYIATTGLLFVALVAAHVLRLFAEPDQVRNPWFVLTTLISLAMTIWAVRLFRTVAAGKNSPV